MTDADLVAEVIEGAVGLDPPVANLLAVAAIHRSQDGHAGEEVRGIGCAQCGLRPKPRRWPQPL
jgi:hypothetical protein